MTAGPPAPSVADLLIDDLDRPFWDGCRQGELLLHQCGVCGQSYWPASACLQHGGGNMAWRKASGLGIIHTYTVIHRQYHPAFNADIPYNVIVVRLDEGPLMHSRLVGFRPDELRVGCRVAVQFAKVAGADMLPVFTPAGTAAP